MDRNDIVHIKYFFLSDNRPVSLGNDSVSNGYVKFLGNGVLYYNSG